MSSEVQNIDCNDCRWFLPELIDDNGEGGCAKPEGEVCLMEELGEALLDAPVDFGSDEEIFASDFPAPTEISHDQKIMRAISQAQDAIMVAFGNCFDVKEAGAMWMTLSKTVDEFAEMQISNLGGDYEAVRVKLDKFGLEHPTL